MYEQLRNEIQTTLSDHFNATDIETIMHVIDQCSSAYTISRQETALSLIEDDLPQICKMYLVSRSIEGLSKRTLKLYKNLLTNMARTIRKPIDKISANDLRIFLSNISMRGTSNRTIESYRIIIGSFFGWAHAEQYITSNPSVLIKPIKYEHKQREALNQFQLEELRQYIKDPLERAMFEFMYSTGCRVSEMVAVNKSDIMWSDLSLKVMGKGSKEREVWLNAKSATAIRAYLNTRTDDNPALFVTTRNPHDRIGIAGVEKRMRELSGRAGMNRVISPHIMRHTCATTMLRGGAPIDQVQHTLGHASVATTQQYAETCMEDVRRSHDRYVI